MNGIDSKYYFYKNIGSGRITIPTKIAKILGWEHLDTIRIELKNIENKSGLFLFKKEKE